MYCWDPNISKPKFNRQFGEQYEWTRIRAKRTFTRSMIFGGIFIPAQSLVQWSILRPILQHREVATKFRLGGQPVVTMTSQF